jgi:hypothetical protein
MELAWVAGWRGAADIAMLGRGAALFRSLTAGG